MTNDVGERKEIEDVSCSSGLILTYIVLLGVATVKKQEKEQTNKQKP